MGGEKRYQRLAAALREQREIVERWLTQYKDSRLRLPRPVADDETAQFIQTIVDNLADALDPQPLRTAGKEEPPARLLPGLPELREVEKAVAFIGGTLATSGAGGFDVAALILSMRDAVNDYVDADEQAELSSYCEWLSILAVDSFSSACAQAERERMRDLLEEGTPVVQVVPELPAALLVGSPDGSALESIFARLTLLCVRVGAPSAILDVSGVVDQVAPALLQAFERFSQHRKIHGHVALLVVGLAPDSQAVWERVLGLESGAMVMFGAFDQAVAHGLKLASYRLVRG